MIILKYINCANFVLIVMSLGNSIHSQCRFLKFSFERSKECFSLKKLFWPWPYQGTKWWHMPVCLSAGENVPALCLRRFPCQTPPSQDQRPTRSHAFGRWRLCAAGCNGNAPGGGHKSTDITRKHIAKPYVILQGKLLSFSRESIFKLKGQI